MNLLLYLLNANVANSHDLWLEFKCDPIYLIANRKEVTKIFYRILRFCLTNPPNDAMQNEWACTKMWAF